jgi:2-(1,2-epoxy-1,2-dihydrophenyl)acetyl-CoA isomerase
MMSGETEGVDAKVVQYEVSNGVARITLNRPKALNALTRGMLEGLAHAASRALLDDSVRAVLLTGNGRGFCAGADVKEMAAGTFVATPGESPLEGALSGAGILHKAIATLHRLPKPVVAAINGPTAGAGLGIAMACDVLWAAQSATFSTAYTAIGLSPDGGTTYALPRLVGAKVAAELFFTNRKFDADEALRLRFVSRVLPDVELLPAAIELANTLARGPTLAYASAKALLRMSGSQSLETQMEDERLGIMRSATTEDFMRGVTALASQQQPVFVGK